MIATPVSKRVNTPKNNDPGLIFSHAGRANLSISVAAEVQEWVGDADIATTRIYDRRKMKPEDSPTFKIIY